MRLRTIWIAFLYAGTLLAANPYCAGKGDTYRFTLEQAVQRALSHNKQLISAADALEKANLGVAGAKADFAWSITPHSDAGLMWGGDAGDGPTFGVGIDLGKKMVSGTKVTMTPEIKRSQRFYYSDARVSITQPLIRGFGKEYNLSNVRAAEFSVRNSVRKYYTTQDQIIIRTIGGVYDVVKATREVELNQQLVDRMHKLRDAAEIKEKMGLCDTSDLYKTLTETQKAEEKLRNAQGRLQDNRDALKELLDLPLNANIEVNAPIATLDLNVDDCTAIDTAVKHRIELEGAVDGLQEAIRKLRVAKRGLLPDLNLVVRYSNCGKQPEFIRSCTYRRVGTYAVGFTTSTDLTPFQARSSIRQSEISVAEAKSKVGETKNTVIMEVKKALRTLERAQKNIVAQQEQIETSEGQLRLNQLKFERGMTGDLDVMNCTKTLLTAQHNYEKAVIEHIVGKYKLYQALGTLTDKPLIRMPC